ncbi:serine hydrolase domain-containing protein [Lentimicrobium sp. S6]|uniref:serine hydrolase domain-containing protein n=1 Tax=Lentimicrobium sp. S6 TaxID=2735872 RepID=UPI0015580404|nr:serine hydrolase domain-containing protein [Lentimicrobium sp. S6]NPD47298.1 serine hydrolase [Lentimicrobium sp. S6]
MKTMKSKLNLIIIATFLLNNMVIGQISNVNNIKTKIDEVAMKAVELELFSGAILVAEKGKIIYSKAFGEANKDHNIKNNLETKFNIASIGKSFTSTATMILAQKGLLKINDPVIKYLPNFPFGKEITIHHLLTHTSGLGDYLSNPVYVSNKNNLSSINDLIPIIYSEDLIFSKPGEYMAYSNSGAIVMGAVIESITGQSYFGFLQQNIFSPLNMNNTSYKNSDDVIPNRATGYIKKMSGGFSNNSHTLYAPSPAGGLQLTVGDLFLFDQALYDTLLLSDEYKKIMFTPYKNNYACYWGVFERFNNTVIGHAGGSPGINTWFRRYINDEYTIIVLSNYDNGAESIFFKIESILFNQEYSLPRTPVAEFLYPLIKDEGVELVHANISEILKKSNYQIPNSDVLNTFGYALLQQNDTEMAINCFLLNTYLFKDDANIFDSLGEAYMKAGKRELAIENYEKSIKLNPKNASAIKMLEKLRQ